MKTTEQIKSEVVSYLNKTSNHLFADKNGQIYKLIIEDDNFIFIVMDKDAINGRVIGTYNVNEHISWYGGNAKNVIKHKLFLGKKLHSIKNFKVMKAKVDLIKIAITGKTDKAEITKIVTQILTGVAQTPDTKTSFLGRIFGK